MREDARLPDPRTAPIREMFAAIAPRYDLLNRLLSLGLDQTWRRALARETVRDLTGERGLVLDLATGTGDTAEALCRRLPRGWTVVGADLTPEMLRRARFKLRRRCARRVPLTAADALSLPFRSGAFRAVTIAFGLRNIPDRPRALRELHRVLAPGGRALVLELSPGTSPFFAPLFRLYFHRLAPLAGGLISGNASAYRYLPASVERFPSPGALAAEMEAAGFSRVTSRAFALGAARLHVGSRPAAPARPRVTASRSKPPMEIPR